MEWIEQHSADPDYLEELRIVSSEPNRPKLTPEEAKAKALELQRELAAKRREADKQAELDAERERMKMTKALQKSAIEQEEA
jgi:hypothetical protein